MDNSVRFRQQFLMFHLILPFSMTIKLVSWHEPIISICTRLSIPVMRVRREAAATISQGLIVIRSRSMTLYVSMERRASLRRAIKKRASAQRRVNQVRHHLLCVHRMIFQVTIRFRRTRLGRQVFFLQPSFNRIRQVRQAILNLLFHRCLGMRDPFKRITFLGTFVRVTLITFAIFNGSNFYFYVNRILSTLLHVRIRFRPDTFSFYISG